MIVNSETITPQELIEFIRESTKRLWPHGGVPFDNEYDGLLLLMPGPQGVAQIRCGNRISDLHIKVTVQNSEEMRWLHEPVTQEDRTRLMLNSMGLLNETSPEELAVKLRLVREVLHGRYAR